MAGSARQGHRMSSSSVRMPLVIQVNRTTCRAQATRQQRAQGSSGHRAAAGTGEERAQGALYVTRQRAPAHDRQAESRGSGPALARQGTGSCGASIPAAAPRRAAPQRAPRSSPCSGPAVSRLHQSCWGRHSGPSPTPGCCAARPSQSPGEQKKGIRTSHPYIYKLRGSRIVQKQEVESERQHGSSQLRTKCRGCHRAHPQPQQPRAFQGTASPHT